MSLEEEKKKIPALAIIYTNNRFIRKINKEFLAHDYITDVIAFPPDKDDGLEAEIYINLDAARNQAKQYGVKYTEEAMRLLIHGALHLLGYNDKTRQEKYKMNERENFYLTVMSRKAGF